MELKRIIWPRSSWAARALPVISVPAVVAGGEPVPARVLQRRLVAVPGEPVGLAADTLVPRLHQRVSSAGQVWPFLISQSGNSIFLASVSKSETAIWWQSHTAFQPALVDDTDSASCRPQVTRFLSSGILPSHWSVPALH